METITYGFKDRPDYSDDYLLDTVGYVTRIWVEQEGERDQVKFSLQIFMRSGFSDTLPSKTMSFVIYLDRGTTVAFAQLQLLRDALNSFQASKVSAPLLVRVHFTFGDEDDLDWGYAYWIATIADMEYPTPVQDYYSGPVIGYFTHVE